jgi:putative glutamine amidotransferase
LESQHALFEDCSGFLLPGSPADIEPSLYDTPRMEACGPADTLREQIDFAILQHARETGKPLLGICFGCQSMNTFYGGALIQDLSPLPVNHEAGAKVAVAHTALIPRDSLLGSIILGDANALTEATPPAGSSTPTAFLRLPINTSHHQSVATTGSSLRIVAHCPDDEVIEAIEVTALFHVEHPGFLLGVQWHPERSVDISATSRALFARLIVEAGHYAITH